MSEGQFEKLANATWLMIKALAEVVDEDGQHISCVFAFPEETDRMAKNLIMMACSAAVLTSVSAKGGDGEPEGE